MGPDEARACGPWKDFRMCSETGAMESSKQRQNLTYDPLGSNRIPLAVCGEWTKSR